MSIALRRLPLLSLAVVALWLYRNTLVALGREWAESADSSYGVLLAVVAIAVMWQRRRALAVGGSSRIQRIAGFALLAFGASLFAAGQLAADVFLTRISFPVVAAGVIAFVSGPAALRAAAAPIAFLLLSIPLPALIINSATAPLQSVASRVAELLLIMTGTPVLRDGNLLQLPGGTLEVAAACSGLRSLVSLGALSVLLAWTMRAALWRRTIVVASTVPIAIITNGIRIAATGYIAETWTQRVLTGSLHELTGWMTFVAGFALLALPIRHHALSRAGV